MGESLNILLSDRRDPFRFKRAILAKMENKRITMQSFKTLLRYSFTHSSDSDSSDPLTQFIINVTRAPLPEVEKIAFIQLIQDKFSIFDLVNRRMKHTFNDEKKIAKGASIYTSSENPLVYMPKVTLRQYVVYLLYLKAEMPLAERLELIIPFVKRHRDRFLYNLLHKSRLTDKGIRKRLLELDLDRGPLVRGSDLETLNLARRIGQ
jgi:hypothetical protein